MPEQGAIPLFFSHKSRGRRQNHFKPYLSQLILQRPTGDPQIPGGIFSVTVVELKGGDNLFPLVVRRAQLRGGVLLYSWNAEQLWRKVPDFNDIRGAHYDDPFNKIPELANISRPVVLQKGLVYLGENSLWRLYFRKIFSEMVGQGNDILFRSRRGGMVMGDHIKPIVEITAECAVSDALGKVHIGGGNKPEIDGPGLDGADPEDGFGLQNPQQLGLKVQRHGVDFVQEQSGIFCGFNNTEFSRGERPSKGALSYPNSSASNRDSGREAQLIATISFSWCALFS